MRPFESADATDVPITFLEKMHMNDFTQLYKVSAHNMTCVLKVFAPMDKTMWMGTPEDLLYNREVSAYKAMKSVGLEAEGYIPKIYATFPILDVLKHRPILDDFMSKDGPPSAILMEYIPDLVHFTPKRYTKSRGERFQEAYNLIHKARVVHLDIKPRHLLVQERTDRIVVLDFDCSRMAKRAKATSENRNVQLLKLEIAQVERLLHDMELDSHRGKPDATWEYYFGNEKPSEHLMKAWLQRYPYYD